MQRTGDAALLVTHADRGYQARQHTMSATGGEWVGAAVIGDTAAAPRALLLAGLERLFTVMLRA